MRAVCCRVKKASVSVEGKQTGCINTGLLVFVAVTQSDTKTDVRWMADKLTSIRLFNDDQGKLNLSVRDIQGGLLLIPNFTLAGRTQKGTRPSFSDAAPPENAKYLFDNLVELCTEKTTVATGVFGQHMHITSQCDGPVTVIINSPTR